MKVTQQQQDQIDHLSKQWGEPKLVELASDGKAVFVDWGNGAEILIEPDGRVAS